MRNDGMGFGTLVAVRRVRRLTALFFEPQILRFSRAAVCGDRVNEHMRMAGLFRGSDLRSAMYDLKLRGS